MVASKGLRLLVPFLLCTLMTATAQPVSEPAIVETHQVRIDADFPGGNIVVDKIVADTVYLHQDLRDTSTNWFFWYFRVRNGIGRTITFIFPPDRAVLGARGPAVSSVGGRSWTWAGQETVHESATSFTIKLTAPEMRFCTAIPYVESNLEQFLARHQTNPLVQRRVLCQTRKGRNVTGLTIRPASQKALHKVILTARHHACESSASYVLEGILDTILLDNSEFGAWLRDNVEWLVVPFMDTDGVEDGDQGKNRSPRDHLLDYDESSIYPEVQALRRFVEGWSDERLHIAIDVHAPGIKGRQHEVVHFVGSSKVELWENVLKLSDILEDTQQGTLAYKAKDNIAFGQSWNVAGKPRNGRSYTTWMSETPGIKISNIIEIPYANAGGNIVTANTAREFGRDMARALKYFLDQLRVPKN
jgi:hypothetical protein